MRCSHSCGDSSSSSVVCTKSCTTCSSDGWHGAAVQYSQPLRKLVMLERYFASGSCLVQTPDPYFFIFYSNLEGDGYLALSCVHLSVRMFVSVAYIEAMLK